MADFLDILENPNEVEDYIQEYLGASKAAKEFTKEYLQKRSESRKRRETEKDVSFSFILSKRGILGSLQRFSSG